MLCMVKQIDKGTFLPRIAQFNVVNKWGNQDTLPQLMMKLHVIPPFYRQLSVMNILAVIIMKPAQ